MARSVELLPTAGALLGGCVYEPKFDGYRALLFVDDGRCRIQSRRRHDITASFPDVAAAACGQLPSGHVVDGELVVWVDGRREFSELQHRLASSTEAGLLAHEKPATFMAFDLLCVDDRDARTMPLRDRRAALAKILPESGQVLQQTPQTRDRSEAESWMADYAAGRVDGLEGVVAKGAAQPYRPGKRDWLKIRVQDTLEVIVGAITGPLTAPDRLVFGQYDATGQLVIIGGTDSLGGRERRLVAPLLHLPKNSHPWPSEIEVGRIGRGAGNQLITRVEPTLVVEVSMNGTAAPGDSPPIAEFVRVRPDLAAEETEVVRVARW